MPHEYNIQSTLNNFHRDHKRTNENNFFTSKFSTTFHESQVARKVADSSAGVKRVSQVWTKAQNIAMKEIITLSLLLQVYWERKWIRVLELDGDHVKRNEIKKLFNVHRTRERVWGIGPNCTSFKSRLPQRSPSEKVKSKAHQENCANIGLPLSTLWWCEHQLIWASTADIIFMFLY